MRKPKNSSTIYMCVRVHVRDDDARYHASIHREECLNFVIPLEPTTR